MGSCKSKYNTYDEDFNEVNIKTNHYVRLKKNQIYVIGANGGELCLNSKERCLSLQSFNKYNHKKDIDTINSSNGHTVYSNEQQNKYWIADVNIEGLQSIDYFQKHNIKIQKICTSIASTDSFFISTENRAYIAYSFNETYHIASIDNLHNVTDIKATADRYYAICDIKKTVVSILNNWSIPSQKDTNIIPDDIIHLISIYFRIKELYIMNNDINFHTHPNAQKSKTLSLTDILKIECGAFHSLFLDSNGNVYSLGDDSYGQCGISDVRLFDDNGLFPSNTNTKSDSDVSMQLTVAKKLTNSFDVAYLNEAYRCLKPRGSQNCISLTMIPYFQKQNIVIKNVKCGSYHCLALDDKGIVYSWGKNNFGQCGDDTIINVFTPQPVEYLKQYKIVSIECGWQHSYAKSSNGMHFLWGSNRNCECTLYDVVRLHAIVKLPHCINQIVKAQTNGKRIKSVSLGISNTKLVMF